METLETREERSEAAVHSVNHVSFRRLGAGGLAVAWLVDSGEGQLERMREGQRYLDQQIGEESGRQVGGSA